MKKTEDSKKPSKHAEKACKKSLESVEKELQQKNDLLLRLGAEYANFKRRTEEERDVLYSNAVGDVLKDFVSVFDDFELALNNSSSPEDFKKGVELIFAKFVDVAQDFGLEKIKTNNEKFNPMEHEALLAESSKKPEQTIIEELQSGYKVKGKVIRTAKVKVAKK